jgi:trehalose-6-phosphate synthase
MSHDGFNKFILGLIKTYNSGKLKSPYKIKKTHINPKALLSPREKSNLSNRVNGIIKRANSIKLIHDTKQLLAEKGDVLSKTKVVEITKLSRPTVTKYWNQVPLDIQAIIDEINDNYWD